MVKSRDESDENFWEAKEVSSSSSDNSIDEQINEFVWDSESDEKGTEQKDAQKNEEVRNVLETSKKGTKENEKKEQKNDEHENETGYEKVEQHSNFAIDSTEEDVQNDMATESISDELYNNNDDLEQDRDDWQDINSEEIGTQQGNDITNTMNDSFDDDVHDSDEYNKQESEQKFIDSLDDQNNDYNTNDDYLTEDGSNSLYTNNEAIDAKDAKEYNNMSNDVIYVDDDNKKGSDVLPHESETAIDYIDHESYNLSLNEHNNSAIATSLESMLYGNQSMDDDYDFNNSNTISIDEYTHDESGKEDNTIDVKEKDTYNEGNTENIDDETVNADEQFTPDESIIETIEDNITIDKNQYTSELDEKDSDLDNVEQNSYTEEDQHNRNLDSERNSKDEMNDNDEPIFDIKQETNIDVNIANPTVNETSRSALLDAIYENVSDTESTDENNKKAQANNIDQDLTGKHFITKEIIAQEDQPQEMEEYLPEFETIPSIVSVKDSEACNDFATSNNMAQDSNSQYIDLHDDVDADLCKDSVDSDHTYMHKYDEGSINDEEVYDTIGNTVLEERNEETIIEDLRDDIDMPQQETEMDIWSDESDNGFENLLGTDKAVNEQDIDALLTGHVFESKNTTESDASYMENIVAQSDMNNNGQSLEFLYTDTVDSQQLNNYVADELAYHSDNKIHDGVNELCNFGSKLKQTNCETGLLVPENVRNAEQPHVIHKASVAPESLIKLTKTESQSSHNYLNDLVESLQPLKQTDIPAKSSVSSFIPKHKQFKMPSTTKSAEQNKEVTIKNYQSKKTVYARKEKRKPSFENRSLICFIDKKVIHNRTFEQKRVSVEGEGYNSCTKSSFTYYKNPESELMTMKELTDYEMSIKKLLNTKIDKIREQIAEIPKFDMKCKVDKNVNSCFDETLADLFLRDPQTSVDNCIANDNWLMALLLSNYDTVKREDTLLRFLTKFVDGTTLPVYLIKFRMYKQALDRIKSMNYNPSKYLNIVFMHFDKYFVEEYVKIIASHNRLDALRAYIIVNKLYDVDIDINLFVNNIFALEILNEMDKTKKVANIDFLRFNHINYLLNYNRDEAYNYYAKYKGGLRKEYVAELDAIFVDKKWNFGGFRKVVDLGISKIIGVEIENTKTEKKVVKVQMKKVASNEKQSKLDEKVTVEKSVDNSTTVKMEMPKKSEQLIIADTKQADTKSQIIETKKPSYGELLKRKSQVQHLADNLFDELKQNNVESNEKEAETQEVERATDVKPVIDSNLSIDVHKSCKNEEILPTDDKTEEVIKESPVRKNTLYKNEKFAQSYADFFDKEAVNDLELDNDTKNLLSQFTRDDSEIGKQTKKVEEPKPDKPSFFSFSRFFKPKEKTYKAKIESDAKFVFDPVTKQWVNKNSDSKPSFDYTTIKKEKTEPKKSDGFVKKTTSAGLSGRYAGMKMSKQSVADLIPGIKKDKNVDN